VAGNSKFSSFTIVYFDFYPFERVEQSHLCMQRPNRALIDCRGFLATLPKDVGRAVRQRLWARTNGAQWPDPLIDHRRLSVFACKHFAAIDVRYIRQPIPTPSAHP
jgi:hypothetical protein